MRAVHGTDNLMSRLSRQCEILNISQSYRPSRPVMGMAFTLARWSNHLQGKLMFYNGPTIRDSHSRIWTLSAVMYLVLSVLNGLHTFVELCKTYLIFVGQMPEDVRWLVLTLGEQHQKTSPLSPRWQESPSFLISSLQTDKLIVKLKTKRLVSSITLALFELPLSNYNLDSAHM
jgi:hypothetical protein